jgi:hypothetical protein
MIRWADDVNRPLPSMGELDVLFNANAPNPGLAPTGSVRMVFAANSYNR